MSGLPAFTPTTSVNIRDIETENKECQIRDLGKGINPHFRLSQDYQRYSKLRGILFTILPLD